MEKNFLFSDLHFKLRQTSVVTVAGWKEKSGSGGRRSCSDISGTYVYFLGTYNNVQTKLIMMSDREKSWWSSQYMSYE